MPRRTSAQSAAETAPSPLPVTAEGWALFVDEFRAGIAALDEELGAIEQERRGLALDAQAGDGEARRRVVEIGDREGAILGELRVRRAALADAEERHGAAVEAERQVAIDERLAAARVARDAFLEASQAVDDALRALVEGLGRRAALARDLASYGVTTNRLLARSYVSSVVAGAGLKAYCEIETARRTGTMAGTDATLIDAGLSAIVEALRPGEVPPPPVRLTSAEIEQEARERDRARVALQVARLRKEWEANPYPDDRERARREVLLSQAGLAA